MRLQGKTAIVTGAARGIGLACARTLAGYGANVIVNTCDAADEAADKAGAGEAALKSLRDGGARAERIDGDIGAPATAQALAEAAVDAFGGLDIVVNNAGICPFSDFLDITPEMLERITRTNYFGTFFMTQCAARRMIGQGRGGAIVTISSISALVGGGRQAHYTPTKAAVHSLMQSAAVSLGPHKIRCNSVMPGTVATDINAEDLSAPGKREYFEDRIPLGRIGAPDDIAEAAAWLASDEARYVTGAALLADGGLFVNLQ